MYICIYVYVYACVYIYIYIYIYYYLITVLGGLLSRTIRACCLPVRSHRSLFASAHPRFCAAAHRCIGFVGVSVHLCI